MQSHRQAVSEFYEAQGEFAGTFGDAPRAAVPGEFIDPQPEQHAQAQPNSHVQQQQQQSNGHVQQSKSVETQPTAAQTNSATGGSGDGNSQANSQSNVGDETDDEFERNLKAVEKNPETGNLVEAADGIAPPSPETLARMMAQGENDAYELQPQPMSGLQDQMNAAQMNGQQGQPMSGLEDASQQQQAAQGGA